jgi:uncharacterized membrane protein YfcA
VTLSVLLLFLVIGVIGGLIGGMMGVGGGILFVPCLHFGFRSMGLDEELSMRMALATSLAIILVTALSSALGHAFNDVLDARAVLLMAAMAVPASLAGVGVAYVVKASFLKILFGCVSCFISIQFMRPIPRHHTKGNREITAGNYVMVGGVSGLFSSLLGVGGGIITVPLLHLGLNQPMNIAVANSSGLIVFSAFAGTLGYIFSGWDAEGRPPLSFGYVNLAAWVLIAFGAIVTAQAGAFIVARIRPSRLRFPFGVLLMLVGLNMLLF